MAEEIARGEIWLLEVARPHRRRPVLVLSRNALLSALHTATVAAITRSIHGSPTEVVIGVEEGLKTTSCVNLANLFTVRKTELRHYIGSLAAPKMNEVCRALAIAVACEA